MVKILIFGLALREIVEDPEVEITLEKATSLRQLFENYPDQFQRLMPFLHSSQLMLTINQKISTLEAQVRNGDTVKITYQSGDDHADGAMWQNP